jgi:hypothetical protein
MDQTSLSLGPSNAKAPFQRGNWESSLRLPGPSEPVAVHRKERRFGIWVNTDTVEVDAAPSFYAIATSAPLDRILKDTEDLRHQISIERAIRSVGAPYDNHGRPCIYRCGGPYS